MANAAILKLLKEKFGKAKAVSGGNYRVHCTTCEPGAAKKMKRYISPDWPMSNCFICGELKKVSDLLNGEDFKFKTDCGSPQADDGEDYPYAKQNPYTRLVMLQTLPEDHPVIKFLRKDHLNDFERYTSLGVGYIPHDGASPISFDSGFKISTAGSLFFPVYHNREYVGWQLRFIPGTANGDSLQYMKYMHLFPKGNHLFNYDGAKNFKHVIVVEGAKKALKAVNAVATLGKGISHNQKQLIQEWRKITLILDGEDNTQAQAEELAEEFRSNGRECINIDPRKYGFLSPDEATTEQLRDIVNNLWTN
jgi:hypothetical protein